MKNTLRFKHFIKPLLALIVFAQASVLSQPAIEWNKTVGGNGGDFFHSVSPTTDGGYILAGESDSGISGDKSQSNLGLSDYWVIKIAADGTKQWDRRYGGRHYDVLLTVQQTFDGGYILGGYSYSGIDGDKSEPNHFPGEIDYWIVKINSDGVKQWDRTIGTKYDDELSALVQTADGGFLLGGSSPPGASGDKTSADPGFWIVKLTSTGIKEWDRTYATTYPDVLSRFGFLKSSADGNCYIGGSTLAGITADKSENSKGERDIWIIKIKPDGTKIWDKTIGGQDNDNVTAFEETPDGGFILGGNSSSPVGGDKTEAPKGTTDFWIVKLDKDRNVQWDKTLGGTQGRSELTSLVLASDGGYVLAGSSNAKANEDLTRSTYREDYWVVKIDSNGSKIWDKALGGDATDFAVKMCKAPDGGLLIGGQSLSGNSGDKTAPSKGGERDYWIVKLATEQPSLAEMPIRINAGGPAFTTATKKLFIADKYYVGIDRVSSIATGDIPNTSNDILYQSARCSPSFSYNIPVPNGEVSVYLHFAETYFGAPGKKGGKGSRQFHVNMEGVRKLTNYDIFAKTGGAMLATAETFTVNVTDGMLNIDFLSGAADLPRVSAIEVLPSPQRTLTFTPVADAFVREEKYANQNFGSDPLLSAKSRGQVGQIRQAYLRFAIPGISNVKSAKLRLYGNNHEAETSVDVNAVSVDDDSWTENGITWNNAPTMGRAMGSHVFVNETLKYWEIDVTQYVAAQAVGDQIVSLGIFANRRFLMNFHSKENPSGFAPQLVIVTGNTTNQVTRLGSESEETSESNTALSSVIYPNPAKDHIMLEISSGHKSEVDLELTNMAGSRFQLQRPETEGSASRLKVGLPAQLPAGMYLLKVQSKEFSEVLKVLVTE